MLFQFRSGNVTFFPEDQEYFEKRLSTLKKYLGSYNHEDESVDVHVSIEKNRHQTGDRFDCSITLHCPRSGKFYTEVSEQNIKKCADTAEAKLRAQIEKFKK